MKIYIAGKISGEDMAECAIKFEKAYKEIRSMGADAVNPLTVVDDPHAAWQDAMRKCVRAMMGCDAVFALPDYTDSKGAMIETDLALTMKIPVYHSLRTLRTAIKNHP